MNPFPQVPQAAPTQQPMPQQMPNAPELASPDQLQELQTLLGKVKDAQAQLVTKRVIKKNEVNSMQKQLMNSFFAMLQSNGVDPSNPESIKAFLAELEKRHPDLLELFMQAFQDLNGGPLQGMAQPPPQELMGGGQPTGSLMDRYRGLPGAMPQ